MRGSTLLLLFLSVTGLFANWTEKITLNGYSSFEFEKKIEGDDGKGDEHGSFDADLFDIVLNVRASDKVRVAADITWEHGAASEDSTGNVALEYAFTEYIHSDALKFRAGKMFTAFGIYNEIHTAKPATVNYKEPYSTNKIYKIGGDVNYFPRWGAGVSLNGNSGVYEYIFQVTNGYMDILDEDHNPYDKDDNSKKAFSGRVKANLDGLELGFSFYSDAFVDYDDVEDLGNASLNSYGVHLIADVMDDFILQAEAITGDLDRVGQDKINRDSLSLMGVYDLSDTVRAYYIFEYFDPNRKLSDDRVIMNSLGVNFEIDGTIYLKCELYNTNSQDANKKLNGSDYSEFRTAFVVGF